MPDPKHYLSTANRLEREAILARRDGRPLGARLLHDKAVQMRGVARILLRETCR